MTDKFSDIFIKIEKASKAELSATILEGECQHCGDNGAVWRFEDYDGVFDVGTLCEKCIKKAVTLIIPTNQLSEEDCIHFYHGHCWIDTTIRDICYPTNPPKYPPETRKCKHCGLSQTLIKEHKEYWHTEAKLPRNDPFPGGRQ